MKAAIYPGTFNPPTLGHLNVIQRVASNFDRLVIGVGNNLSKESTVFSLAERVQFFETITQNIPNIEIVAFEGLLVDFAKSQDINVIVRAIRTIFDFEYETLQAQMNRQLGDVGNPHCLRQGGMEGSPP